YGLGTLIYEKQIDDLLNTMWHKVQLVIIKKAETLYGWKESKNFTFGIYVIEINLAIYSSESWLNIIIETPLFGIKHPFIQGNWRMTKVRMIKKERARGKKI
ncbi:hypothetical protein ACJX0J_036825, partial [Zea mays]